MAASAHPGTCLPGERGYLRMSLRGAIDEDIDWRGGDLQCEGGARPTGEGIRASFGGAVVGAAGAVAGGAAGDGRDAGRLRIVFGIVVPPGQALGRQLAAHVTVIVEGQNRLYATQGDDQCQVESLQQQPLLAPPDVNANSGASATIGANSALHDYRIVARGYCIDPAATLDGSGRLYINRFDFAGLARFEDNDPHAHAP